MTAEHIKAIPTVYAGTQFRSRLEAKWAAMFDQLGWRWEYEPFDMEGYIPDFLILGKAELLVEVKPLTTVADLSEIAAVIPFTGRDVLALGMVIFPDDGNEYSSFWPAGAISEPDEDGNPWVAGAYWHECRNCRGLAIHHELGSFTGRPCGCYDGDHYRGWADPRELQAMWSTSRNLSQWNPPR